MTDDIYTQQFGRALRPQSWHDQRNDPCDELDRDVMLFYWVRCATDQGDTIKASVLRAVINGHFGKLVPDPRTADWLAAGTFDNDPCDEQPWAVKEHVWLKAKQHFANGPIINIYRMYVDDMPVMSESGPECIMPREWKAAMDARVRHKHKP